MTVNTSLTRGEHAKVRAHLGALRTSLTQARDALMHFKGDRLDRDKLEPAARRVDDLMNLFGGEVLPGKGRYGSPRSKSGLNRSRIPRWPRLFVTRAPK